MKLKHPLFANSKQAGVFFGAAASLTYGMNPLFALPLYSEGFSPDGVLFLRYLPAVILLGVWMKMRGESFAMSYGEFAWAAPAGLLFAASSLFLFLSYQKMDAGIASTLLFVYPCFTAIIMSVFFREKMTRGIRFSFLLTFCGMALLYRRSDGAPLNSAGVVLVMLSALSYALYLVVVNQTVLKKVPALKLTFYALLFGLLIYMVRLKCGFGLAGNVSFKSLLCIAGIVLLPTIVSLLCTTLAIQHTGATVTAILGALEPVTAVFFGVTVFNEELTLRIAAGILFIIAAVVVIALRGQGGRLKNGDPAR